MYMKQQKNNKQTENKTWCVWRAKLIEAKYLWAFQPETLKDELRSFGDEQN